MTDYRAKGKVHAQRPSDAKTKVKRMNRVNTANTKAKKAVKSEAAAQANAAKRERGQKFAGAMQSGVEDSQAAGGTEDTGFADRSAAMSQQRAPRSFMYFFK